MADLNQLLAQREALEKQIEATRREQRDAALRQVRELIAQHQLTLADLRSAPRAAAAKKAKKPAGSAGKVAAKFRNADTGETWSGRGLQPRWLKAALAQGRKLEDFRV